MAEAVLTVEEAARELRIGRSAAYDAVRRGEIPAVRIGRSIRVPRHQLEAMLDLEHANGAPAKSAAAKTGEEAADESAD